MKHLISAFFSHLGYQLKRKDFDPFLNYRDMARYTPCVVKLDSWHLDLIDGPSFYWAHQEIFVRQIYHFQAKTKEPRIVDCGSNIGLSILYFYKHYPNCTIFGFEADPTVYCVLEKNISTLNSKNIFLFNRAVSTTPGEIQFSQEGADGGRIGYLSPEAKLVTVKTVDLDCYIEEYTDFLKVDIEGVEVDVIVALKNIGNVQNLFIEYHSFRTQPQRLHILLEFLRRSGFRYYFSVPYSPQNPYLKITDNMNMDLQMNIFCVRDNNNTPPCD